MLGARSVLGVERCVIVFRGSSILFCLQQVNFNYQIPLMCTLCCCVRIQVFNNHAFIVSEAFGHGMQVYDLTKLRDLKPSPTGVNQLKATAHYGEMGNTHNIVGNEDSGFMYAVGTSTCRGGLHMIDVNDPLKPKFAGCFGDDGYVHDAQCVKYTGPDTDYTGHEICFCYNENSLTIVDVTVKEDVKMLSTVPYDNSYYTHQVLYVGFC